MEQFQEQLALVMRASLTAAKQEERPPAAGGGGGGAHGSKKATSQTGFLGTTLHK